MNINRHDQITFYGELRVVRSLAVGQDGRHSQFWVLNKRARG